MLKIVVPAKVIGEEYDEVNNEFIPITTKQQTLSLEHSLVSLSKWESKWHKPFLSTKKKTTDEFIDYVRCMTLTQNVDPNVYTALTAQNIKEVSAYIDASMTATTFSKNGNKPPNRETITAEIIYYWMVSYNIPFECQKWHLSRLLTLINVCNVKNAPQKKMSRQEIFARNRALNAARRKKSHSRG
jgi:hypothetical protein